MTTNRKLQGQVTLGSNISIVGTEPFEITIPYKATRDYPNKSRLAKWWFRMNLISVLRYDSNLCVLIGQSINQLSKTVY